MAGVRCAAWHVACGVGVLTLFSLSKVTGWILIAGERLGGESRWIFGCMRRLLADCEALPPWSSWEI